MSSEQFERDPKSGVYSDSLLKEKKEKPTLRSEGFEYDPKSGVYPDSLLKEKPAAGSDALV